MGEPTTIEGVIEGGDVGEQSYVPSMPSPVSDHQPLADVNDDMRSLIEGKTRDYGNATVNGTAIARQEKENDLSIKGLTYVGKGFVRRGFMKVGYALRAIDPISELEKVRDGVEGRISADQEFIKSIDTEIGEIEMELEGVDQEGNMADEYSARRMMKNAEALVHEYDEALKTEQRSRAEETQKAEEVKTRFFEEQDPEKKQELAQVYQAYQQNMIQRQKKEKDLQQKLATVSQQFNLYFDNVDRAEEWKARYTEKRDVLVQDRISLEGVSYTLNFFVKRGVGAMRIARQVYGNQKALELYRTVVDGLEKLNESENLITRRLPGMITKDRKTRKRQKEKSQDKVSKAMESQIMLAKERIKDSSGLGAV